MIDTKTALYVKHDNGLSFTDYSHKAGVFERDRFKITLDQEGYLYIGFNKPVNALYFNCKTPDYDEASMTLEYSTLSSWELLEASDDTLGFMRAGFVTWSNPDDHRLTSIDGKSAYWYRFKVSTDRLDLEFAGINLVFADDYDLSCEYPLINSTEFLGLQSSHILTHVSVCNEILQRLNNKDYYKINSSGLKENLTVWDLHDLVEIRQAAVKLALSKIYRNMSDDPNDVWEAKSKQFVKEFEASLNLARISLDSNDDGIIQPSENKSEFTTRRFTR